MTVLTARCSELERDFSFGAVRQLFEPVARDPARRERLLAGAAAPAEGVLGAPDGDAEGSFAVLHGLYWAALNLAEERPVLIAIDDLQWSDRPSLRFVAYLAHRLEGAPVLVAATVRSTDPGTDPQLLAEIGGRPADRGGAARAAGRGGRSATWCASGSATPDPRLHRRLPGGHRRQPAAAPPAADRARRRTACSRRAAGAVAVRGIGSRAVSRTVLLRLSRLREDAVAVAHAVAVLGESSGLPGVAALTGLDEDGGRPRGRRRSRAPTSCARTRRSASSTRSCATPSTATCPAGERELQHGRAAEVLARAHAGRRGGRRPALHAPRRGDAATVETLRAAAREAVRRGGPESAVAYLARAGGAAAAGAARRRCYFELGIAAGRDERAGRGRAPARARTTS